MTKPGFIREDVDFYSEGTRCSAWLYLPDDGKKHPIVVMAHGLGGTRTLRMEQYGEHFAAAGYASFLFDYRNFGDSDGDKRQLINVKMQLKDWNNAIDFIKQDERVDGEKLLIFGTSFSGGHAVWLSAHRDDIKAAIAQCPYTNTMATINVVGLPYILRKSPYVIADVLSNMTGYHPILLPLSTYSGENAFMEASEETTHKYVGDTDYINAAPARTLLEFVKYSPGKFFGDIKIPIFVAACLDDILAPADKTLELAAKAKYAVCKKYECGHFEIYLEPVFDEAIQDYINFYNQVMKAPEA